MKKFPDASSHNPARRAFIQSSIAAGAGAVAGSAPAKDLATASGVPWPKSPPTPPFVDPLPPYPVKQPYLGVFDEPPGRSRGPSECGRDDHQAFDELPPQKYYQLRVKEGTHKWHRDLPSQKIVGYDGIYPGPRFHARYGEPILVRLFNDIQAGQGFGVPEVSMHLHNLHTPSESDGYPGNYFSRLNGGPTLTPPGQGQYHDHHYPNVYAGLRQYPATNGDPREALGTLWYHDHCEGFTAPNGYSGMVGFYLIFDQIDSGDENDLNPDALHLPSGEYDVPLVLADTRFDSGGYLFYDITNTDGFLGDRYTVNGKVQPFFQVERRRYRFRILNGGPSRIYLLSLLNSANVTQPIHYYIANDGNLLPAPIAGMPNIQLSIAERADIVLDFSRYPLGTQLYLVNRYKQVSGRGPESILLTPGDKMMRFDIVADPAQPDQSQVPSVLRELPPINLAEVVKRRSWRFKRTNDVWTINDLIFNHTSRADIKMGTAEIWTLDNHSGSWWHPIHIHFEEGRILKRNGKAPPAHEVCRKDVYNLKPGEKVEIFMRFRDFQDKYVMHCHNTVHEDHAMMLQWKIVP